MKFSELAKINVNEHTEKKGNLTYLSWAWAVDQLLRQDDTATWEYRWIADKPYVVIGETCMVFCTVRAFGKERTAQLPVLDYKNKAIPNPNSMEINTAMQRCLAKAIALHGIGLYIYAGEDLPNGEDGNAATASQGKTVAHSPTDGSLAALPKDEQEKAKEIANSIVDLFAESKEFAAYELFYDNDLSNEMKLGVWEILRPYSPIRSKLKKMHETVPAPVKKAA